MADGVPYGRVTQRPSPVPDIHILWMTSGLSCDGDSVSITAAMQPSIEDVVMGAIPGLPKVHVHNPVISFEVGDDFLKYWYRPGKASWIPSFWWWRVPFPTRRSRRKDTGRPLARTPRPASPSPPTSGSTGWRPRLWRLSAPARAPPTAAFTPCRAIRPGAMGLADYLGWDWRSKAGLPIVNVPGCPVQPDNFMETLLYLLVSGGRSRAHDSAGRSTASHLAVRQNRSRRLRSRRLLRAGRLRGPIRLAEVHRQVGLLGAGGQLQRSQARLDGGNRRLSQRGRNLHRLHHARLSGQVHAIHGRASRLPHIRRHGRAFTDAR